jgi:hypothetical protein
MSTDSCSQTQIGSRQELYTWTSRRTRASWSAKRPWQSSGCLISYHSVIVLVRRLLHANRPLGTQSNHCGLHLARISTSRAIMESGSYLFVICSWKLSLSLVLHWLILIDLYVQVCMWSLHPARFATQGRQYQGRKGRMASSEYQTPHATYGIMNFCACDYFVNNHLYCIGMLCDTRPPAPTWFWTRIRALMTLFGMQWYAWMARPVRHFRVLPMVPDQRSHACSCSCFSCHWMFTELLLGYRLWRIITASRCIGKSANRTPPARRIISSRSIGGPRGGISCWKSNIIYCGAL